MRQKEVSPSPPRDPDIFREQKVQSQEEVLVRPRKDVLCFSWFHLDNVSVQLGKCFNSISKMFQFNFENVSIQFGKCFNSIWKMFQFSSENISVQFGKCFSSI
jgi:hypothetical protein